MKHKGIVFTALAAVCLCGCGIGANNDSSTQKTPSATTVNNHPTPVSHIMVCCRTANVGTKFLVNGAWDAAHDYGDIETVRSILQTIKDAGINIVCVDFTNGSQWDAKGESALHGGDGGEFWDTFRPMLMNVKEVCKEKDMQYFLFIGWTTGLKYWNQKAKYIYENLVPDETYRRYGKGDDRPILVVYYPGKDFKSLYGATPPEDREYFDKFHIGTCQVNEPIDFCETDGWGYRNKSSSSDNKVRFVCPNSGVAPGEWARVDAEEWQKRVNWGLEAKDYVLFGSYDDTCDCNYWGIADASDSRNPLHKNIKTVNSPYAYYNIVKKSLAE